MLNRAKSLLWSLGISSTMVFILFAIFVPRWETNDDVGMSMAAHGYGLAAKGAPTLIFSNVIWGYLVRAIPEIGGVLGYSIASIGAIIAFGATLLHAFRKSGIGSIFSIAVLALLIIRPALFPQFTINAGLLTVGGLICLFLYGIYREVSTLVVGAVLSFLGFLIRAQEFALVVLVAIPLLPWKILLRDHVAQIAVSLLAIAISVAIYADHEAYQGQAWEEFKEFNSARAPYTDFGADVLLAERLDILKKYNYSQNDISLIGAWFFADTELSNSQTLRSMVKELGPIPNKSLAFVNGVTGLTALTHKTVRAYVLSGLLFMIFAPSRRLLAAWIICLSSFFVLGVLGRPGVLRIYIPVLTLLVIFPIITQRKLLVTRSLTSQRIAYCSLAALLVWNASKVFVQSIKSNKLMTENCRNFVDFPKYPVVVLGGSFPYELVYPVLAPNGSERQFQLYGLGVFMLAPFSRAYVEISHGHGLVQQLRSTEGAPMLARDTFYNPLLQRYCKEHFGGKLDISDIKRYDAVWLRRVRCPGDAGGK